MANVLPTMAASDRNPRKVTGTHYTTPVGNTLNASDDMVEDRQSDTQVDGSQVRAQRTKKLQFVSAELKRMRYF
jgi:hypothetical protein